MINEHWLIPLTPQAQSFGIVLAGCEYRLTLRWFDVPEAGWHIDIQEPEAAAPILLGMHLAAGCDLLKPYAYQEYNGGLWLSSELAAGPDELGEKVRLLFGLGDINEELYAPVMAALAKARAARDAELAEAYKARSAEGVRNAEDYNTRLREEQERRDAAMIAACCELRLILADLAGVTCIQ